MFDWWLIPLVITNLLLASAAPPQKPVYLCLVCGQKLTMEWCKHPTPTCNLGGKHPCPVPLSGMCLSSFSRSGNVSRRGCQTLSTYPHRDYVHYHDPIEDCQECKSPNSGTSHPGK
ncbi:hypothetical protein PGT21_003890 [Puccinia graminis f. sp. tritici]|uniref:Secreted protein n=1 Tax=Puccinia graminis f. sp. tritici TaxID=56615 RepID=A0A5B0MQL6_PUCGR|nr:hypothetical protein PGT21_003890 [Puccinia graminis f. sp. tritici]